MSGDDAHAQEIIEEENYFVSMTDMMVGLVFIFVILLMYFAVQLNQTKEDLAETKENLTNADQTRTKILNELERSLKEQGIEVSIDTENGILRLPEAILFRQNWPVLEPEKLPDLYKVADALAKILPAYTDGLPVSDLRGGLMSGSALHKIEAVFIEGHTDSTGDPGRNWSLSAARAIEIYQQLTKREPLLAQLCSARRTGACVPVLSVSGYGFSRPLDGTDIGPNDSPSQVAEKLQKNRRIDIRILMKAPLSDEVRESIEGQLNDAP